MDQYAQDTPQGVMPKINTMPLQAQVLPQVIELKWENQILRVPNPAHVSQLTQTCAQQAVEIQQLKERQISMQTQIQQLQRAIQQLQNMWSG